MFIPHQLFSSFVRSYYRYKPDLQQAAHRLLLEDKRESLKAQPAYDETECLRENMQESVKRCVRGKDTAIQVYQDFVQYLQRKNIPAEVKFPPIPIDSSFERLMFIAKYLQDPEARVSALPDLLWVSERTIETDMQRLRGREDPIRIYGKTFTIEDMERSRDRVRFQSTAHPLFLTENLTQVIVMLKGLKEMAQNPLYRRYAWASAKDIWEQLSDYAKRRIRFVLGELMPEDMSWYESLTRTEDWEYEDGTFQSERECSVNHDILLDCMKNGKPFCIEYLEEDGPVIYDECTFIPSTYRMTDQLIIDVQCRQGRRTIQLNKVLRSCYTLEELLDF